MPMNDHKLSFVHFLTIISLPVYIKKSSMGNDGAKLSMNLFAFVLIYICLLRDIFLSSGTGADKSTENRKLS